MGIFDFLKKNKNVVNDNVLNETYYDNGKGNIKSKFYLKNGRKEGPSTFFHKNGNIRLNINWKNGDHDNGPWKEYFSNGQIFKEGNIVNGKRNGPWKEYFSNGQLESSGNLNDGNKDGLWKFYSNKSEYPVYEINYKKGKLHGPWKFFEKNKLLISQDWEDGVTIGNSKNYYDNGQVRSEGPLKLPEDYMLSLEELEGNTLLEEFTWINNRKQHGLWKFYSINGKLTSEVKFNEGEEVSEKCWDEDGNEIECK